MILKRMAIAWILGFGLFFAATGAGQEKPDDDAIWRAFISWFSAASTDSNPFNDYAAKLRQEGVPVSEVRRRVASILQLISQHPERAETYFDWVFSRPVTGNPEKDGFSMAPSAFLVMTVKGMKAGAALDVGVGQGRNAVYLAREGWDVTGMDFSQVALDAARANAAKSGVSIRTEKSAYEEFDFGVNKWDLIVMLFAWAPVSDPTFVAKVKTSLRPCGAVLFEHFCQPMPAMIRALQPGELKTFFAGFDIESYEETQDIGDWGGPDSRLVRMLARKRP
jgi:2-polyprenyl-3-methyl-5-hydroxy-6-metoxy-1,4-benzoquinol methylase